MGSSQTTKPVVTRRTLTYTANMKSITTVFKLSSLAVFSIALACLRTQAADYTALELIKEGNRYVGEQAKDKVVQIRSEKSVASLTPIVWYGVFYDSTATLKAVEVKFGAGKRLQVQRPFRLLEPVTGGGPSIRTVGASGGRSPGAVGARLPAVVRVPRPLSGAFVRL